MTRGLQENEKITIVFSEKVANFDALCVEATLMHTPADTGDCFHFLLGDGRKFVVNPQSSVFVGILQEQP